MKASLIYTFLLLAMATRIQKASGARSPYGEEQLRGAAIINNVDLVKSLLESGVDAKGTDKWGETALMDAAGYGYDKLVELLLPYSDVQATDNDGASALIKAAENGYAKSVEVLLPFSDAKASNKWGQTALDVAQSETSNGHKQIVRLLQQHSN